MDGCGAADAFLGFISITGVAFDFAGRYFVFLVYQVLPDMQERRKIRVAYGVEF